jgi:hypothetical protein
MSKRLTSLLKRLLHRLLTKIAGILLYVMLGYQFCQNCFIQSGADMKAEPDASYSIFTHIAIAVAVLFRSVIVVLEKRNAMNQLDYVKKLQEKQQAQAGNYYGLKSHQQAIGDEIELAPGSGTNKRKHYEYAFLNFN